MNTNNYEKNYEKCYNSLIENSTKEEGWFNWESFKPGRVLNFGKIHSTESTILNNRSLFKKSNFVWNANHFNSTQNVGHVMAEIKKCKPQSVEDWMNYYFSNVRDYDKIVELGEKFSLELRRSGINVDEDIATDFVIYRVIYQTFYGYNRENDAIKWLYKYRYPENLGYIIEKSNEQEDRELGIDLIVTHANDDGTCELVEFIQVKPNSAIITEEYPPKNWAKKAITCFINQFDKMIKKYDDLLFDDKNDNIVGFRVLFGENQFFNITGDMLEPGYQLPVFVYEILNSEDGKEVK